MFLRVVILVFVVTCCTSEVIDVTELQNPWERSGKFEGDIVFTEEQLRNGFNYPPVLWPNNVVPIVIDSVFNFDERLQILKAISDYHNNTFIRFRFYDEQIDSDYIHITGNDYGCWSYVGRKGGRQQLNLQPDQCLTHGTIIHELLHALGFWHQHTATDRDDYVEINWDNVEEGKENSFFVHPTNTDANFGVPYDYDSVMHCGEYAFSKNGNKTIEPKDANATIGQREGFSEKDIEKLAKMYGSASYATPSLFITLIIITLNVLTHLQ